MSLLMQVQGNEQRPIGQETKVMDKFETLTGIAAPMPLVNIDTDMNHSQTVPEDDQTVRPWGEPV